VQAESVALSHDWRFAVLVCLVQLEPVALSQGWCSVEQLVL
jgi:hypothetical protein